MLSFKCIHCGEKKLIKPINTEPIQFIEDLRILCTVCGAEDKPSFYESDCEGME